MCCGLLKLESVTSVQRRFRQEYRVRKTPNYKSIMLWYRTFEETGFKIPLLAIHVWGGGQFDQDRTWTCCNTFSYPSCNRTTAWILCSEDSELEFDYIMVSHIYLDDTFDGNWCG